ncbi:MAG: GNAT family N-acetyltransferase [Clostridia bacterium]|nr:GNAT family N-acetyltransferase [Clostridia bacterium]
MRLIQARKLAHRIKIHRLYRKAFPTNERKPFFIIRSMQKKGKTDVWYFEKEGAFVGFATTINGGDRILLDYLAVVEKKRGKGIGTDMLKLLRTQYEGKGIFLEIERPCADAPNAEERIRRKQFYLSCGMKELNVSARVFGVDMELLGWDCVMDYEDYRLFYRDNYSEFAAEHIQRCDGDSI